MLTEAMKTVYYEEGKAAKLDNQSRFRNPYYGLAAFYWEQGWLSVGAIDVQDY